MCTGRVRDCGASVLGPVGVSGSALVPLAKAFKDRQSKLKKGSHDSAAVTALQCQVDKRKREGQVR